MQMDGTPNCGTGASMPVLIRRECVLHASLLLYQIAAMLTAMYVVGPIPDMARTWSLWWPTCQRCMRWETTRYAVALQYH